MKCQGWFHNDEVLDQRWFYNDEVHLCVDLDNSATN